MTGGEIGGDGRKLAGTARQSSIAVWIPAFAGMTGGEIGNGGVEIGGNEGEIGNGGVEIEIGNNGRKLAGLVRAAVRYSSAESSGMERSMNLLGSASAVFAEAASTMRS